MDSFFLVAKVVFIFGLTVYLLFKKSEFCIMYLPVIFFTEKIVSDVSPAFLYYGVVSMIILVSMIRHNSFYRQNIWAILLILYFLLLLNRSNDLVLIRPYVFSVVWFFASVPVVAALYKNYPSEVIYKELSQAALLILILFIMNSMAATVYKFAPAQMYGIKSGILYGNLYAAAFNTLPFAIFLGFNRGINERKLLYLGVSIVAFFLVLLSLRRTVMGLSALAILINLMTMLTREKAKVLIVGLVVLGAIGYFVYSQTDFMGEFKQRVELRKLDDRDLAEEKRFLEYDLLYTDMFVYHAYSPWTGYDLFNSSGNYGNGILGDRSLHGDLTNIIHSSGLIGVTLYLLMMGTAFFQSFRASSTYQEKLIILFCCATFLAYTGSGRYTEGAASVLQVLVLLLPTAKHAAVPDEQPYLFKQPEIV
ncbi:hypothetical protein A4H97_24410 [Niastella yeongjuensis]|uniref:O-antigen polymerase n=1 Tax=Niastella yeongjuensis TaxID=354355 RepID=A0A1V9F3I8_9BACT|nr:hypothetical protein [Niastella yeongjuensis]OQP52842.1 hypothetical protein A4H97_24410 [Niastella yeongjuensis]SEP20938.1 hypothetical protein SAMN05660816_04770 [Niastella yeongjuensis]